MSFYVQIWWGLKKKSSIFFLENWLYWKVYLKKKLRTLKVVEMVSIFTKMLWNGHWEKWKCFTAHLQFWLQVCIMPNTSKQVKFLWMHSRSHFSLECSKSVSLHNAAYFIEDLLIWFLLFVIYHKNWRKWTKSLKYIHVNLH